MDKSNLKLKHNSSQLQQVISRLSGKYHTEHSAKIK